MIPTIENCTNTPAQTIGASTFSPKIHNDIGVANNKNNQIEAVITTVG
jgi:hypothetical protein